MHEVALPDGCTLTVEPAQEWTELFARTSGWTGADGIYTLPLSGDDSPGAGARTATLLVFGDTFIGSVDRGGARVGAAMVNNTLAVLEGAAPDPSRIRFLWRTTADGRPASMIVPRTPRGREVPNGYYWLQDGAVVGDAWYCFPVLIGPNPAGPEGFQFALHDVTRVAVPTTTDPDCPLDWSRERQVDTPLHYQDGDGHVVHFGAALLPNTRQSGAPQPDGFVYVYGLLQAGGPVPHRLVVARVPEAAFADDAFAAWRFWDGGRWQPDRTRVAPVAPAVSPEASVSPLVGGGWHGRYALTCQLRDTVALYLADGPAGPFRDPVPLWRCPETRAPDRPAGVYVYNAKAHPHLALPGELLVSYNVNTTRWDEHLRHADIYRPRFLRVRAEGGPE